MADFLFPQGHFWILGNETTCATVDLEGGGQALLLFSDPDLAATYGEAAGLTTMAARVIRGKSKLAQNLKSIQELGISHVMIDNTFARAGGHTMTIDKAIHHAETQTEETKAPEEPEGSNE